MLRRWWRSLSLPSARSTISCSRDVSRFLRRLRTLNTLRKSVASSCDRCPIGGGLLSSSYAGSPRMCQVPSIVSLLWLYFIDLLYDLPAELVNPHWLSVVQRCEHTYGVRITCSGGFGRLPHRGYEDINGGLVLKVMSPPGNGRRKLTNASRWLQEELRRIRAPTVRSYRKRVYWDTVRNERYLRRLRGSLAIGHPWFTPCLLTFPSLPSPPCKYDLPSLELCGSSVS